MKSISWGSIEFIEKYTVSDIYGKLDAKGNPFDEIFFGRFISPMGRVLKIPGFFKGNGIFAVRFSPDEVGTWSYSILIQEEILATGQIICTELNNVNIKGELRVSEDRKGFDYSNGDPCFAMGYECNWLWALHLKYRNTTELNKLLKGIKAAGFNQLRMNVYAYDTDWCKGNTIPEDYGPPTDCCFGGTNDNPDFELINTDYFDSYDVTVEKLSENGIYAYLYFKVFNKNVVWPSKKSLAEERFFRYIIARYQSFYNVIWDFSKEAYYEVDKEYIYNFYSKLIELDAYKRLKTLHDDEIYYNNGNYRNVLDFFTSQQHFDIYTSALLHAKEYKMPVSASEFGYECGPLGMEDLSYLYGNTPEEFVSRAYEIVMAGAYPTYYYTYTAWDIIMPDHTPKGYRYWSLMKSYFERIGWRDYKPRPEICCWKGRCLAKNNDDFIFMIEKNASALFNLKMEGRSFTAEWFNIFTGEYHTKHYSAGEVETMKSPDLIVLSNPFKDQWAIVRILKEKI